MSIEDRVSELEARMRVAEDHRILYLLNTYGPLVDSDEGDAAARLWIGGGVHDIDSIGAFAHARLPGKQQVRPARQVQLLDPRVRL